MTSSTYIIEKNFRNRRSHVSMKTAQSIVHNPHHTEAPIAKTAARFPFAPVEHEMIKNQLSSVETKGDSGYSGTSSTDSFEF